MGELVEELRRGAESCRKVLTGEVLPHQVNAWELWETLARASDRLSEPEEYLLYASLMRLIVATVRLQCRWLRYEADELYVDSDIARKRIVSLPLQTLSSILAKSLHPLVELEELTPKALEMGMEHWVELEKARAEVDAQVDGLLTFGEASSAGGSVVQEVRFQGLLDQLEDEFSEESKAKPVPYLRFISRRGKAPYAETATRSYLTSFLISQGRLGLEMRQGEAFLVAKGEAPPKRGQSVAVVLSRPGRR